MTRVDTTRRTQDAPAARPADNAATRFLEQAMKFRGQPYRWGGGHGGTMAGPGPVDCSGLVMQAARQAGVNLDGTAAVQQDKGRPVSMSDLKPGDLVFKGNPAHHVGIYIGNGQVLHAPKTGDVVRIVGVGYFDNARRVFDEGGAPVDTTGLPTDPAPSGGTSSGGGSSPGGGSDSSSVSGNSRPSSMSLSADAMREQNRKEIERGQQRIAAAAAGTHSGLQNVNSSNPGNMAALMGKLGEMGVSPEFLQNLSQQYGVPLEMILAVIQQESGGDPNAQSPVGAQGLMQLMPGTAAELGVQNALDPKQNVEGGVKYLAQMLKQFDGDTAKALAGYNAGPGNVQKYGGVPPFAETQKYVANITGMMNQSQA